MDNTNTDFMKNKGKKMLKYNRKYKGNIREAGIITSDFRYTFLQNLFTSYQISSHKLNIFVSFVKISTLFI